MKYVVLQTNVMANIIMLISFHYLNVIMTRSIINFSVDF